MKKGSISLFIIILFSVNTILVAQSNLIIDQLLEEDRATYGKTVYLVLTAAELLSEEDSVQKAFTLLNEKDWGIKIKQEMDVINIGEYSFLLMKAFNINGGIMYSIFPGPRYAARELYYLGFFFENPSADRYISGEEIVEILGRVLAWKEETG